MDLSQLTNPDRPSDFAEPTSVEYAAMYTDAVVLMLAQGGQDRISMGAVARWMRQVPSAVKQMAGGRERFLEMVVGRFARRWRGWASIRGGSDGLVFRLPKEFDEIHGVRVWASLRDLAAGEARAGRTGLAELVAEADRDERTRVFQSRFGRDSGVLDEDGLMLLWCLAHGLRAAMVDHVQPLSYERAARMLRRATESLRRAD